MHQRHQAIKPAASLFVLAVSACSQAGNLPLLTAPPIDSGYRLGTGDQVRVITFGEQTLTGQFNIDDSGKLALPLLGPLPAEGLTTADLTDEISQALKTKNLIQNPSVVVEVAVYRPVFVLGEVQRPGQFPYEPHMTLLAAVALAGGFTPRAEHDVAEVVRVVDGKTVDGKVTPVSPIVPGDVITVLERKF